MRVVDVATSLRTGRLSTDCLVEYLKVQHLGPTSIHHLIDGKTRLVWRVDDDADRYVELVDSINTGQVVMLMRDGWESHSRVMAAPEVVASQLRQYLRMLGAKFGTGGEGVT